MIAWVVEKSGQPDNPKAWYVSDVFDKRRDAVRWMKKLRKMWTLHYRVRKYRKVHHEKDNRT